MAAHEGYHGKLFLALMTLELGLLWHWSDKFALRLLLQCYHPGCDSRWYGLLCLSLVWHGMLGSLRSHVVVVVVVVAMACALLCLREAVACFW